VVKKGYRSCCSYRKAHSRKCRRNGSGDFRPSE
jgi:hypothetical protein